MAKFIFDIKRRTNRLACNKTCIYQTMISELQAEIVRLQSELEELKTARKGDE